MIAAGLAWSGSANTSGAHGWVPYVTLVFAGVAALGGIAGAAIAAVSASRREWRSWLREQQARVSQDFHLACRSSLAAATGGAMGRALQHGSFDGLGEAREGLLETSTTLMHELNQLLIYAKPGTLVAAHGIVSVWDDLLSRAAPLPGCLTRPAITERDWAIQSMAALIGDLDVQIREDLGVMRAPRWWRPSREPTISLGDIWAHLLSPQTDGHATLISRRVRKWNLAGLYEPHPDLDYTTDDVPWSALRVNQHDLMEPLAAVLRKLSDGPWCLAIDSSLPALVVTTIESEAAQIVANNGRASELTFGGTTWVEGETPGEQIRHWKMSAVARLLQVGT